MGKERAVKKERHNPLHVQLLEDKNHGRKNFKIKTSRRNQEKDDEYVEPSLSRKILTIAREQQEELEEENNLDKSQINKDDQSKLFSSIIENESEEEDYSDEEEIFEYEELEIDEGDQVILEKFLPNAPKERKTLADLIMEKIESRNIAKDDDTTSASQSPAISPKVVEVYTKVGTLLSRYKSGKLPKAFKIIPSLSNWEDILCLTHPENWTPHATFQATRIFVSNLKAKQTQRFFDLVLLEKVRDDIQENKKLNYHLYMALKKALYKPAAFFKGILFPLCESGSCTLKEAVIIGSVISKVSIPMLHSSAGLLRLAEMEYSGSNSLFIRILLDKKYALPYKVVDALVFHFMRFKNDERTMPVLWHQSFLVFAQRYKQDLTPEQKSALLDVLKVKSHDLITPEIRREIVNSVTRGEIMVDEMEIV
ncbi:17907_t:CDS:2 [Funneliformis geosporum]|uniref:7048_t:CDS:1 n=1 Tax=Funneliformis geosporum TaxID=1117311 RepID=A0A9W4WLC2_9GLOM|nr:7048_t:CDS:2 [Funneliformis geosporum]CAI2174423.1 17907_t:CDS:2 [Funneliformis geosporum]